MNSKSAEPERIGPPISIPEIEAFMARLAVVSPAVCDRERIDRIGALEALKASAAAAQAYDVVAFADSQVHDQAARGVRGRDQGVGVASQIALACRQSPHRGSRMLTTARALLTDLPRTLEALSRGETSEYRATVMARETAILDREHRRRVDAELGPRLAELGDRRVEAQARGWACRLDPEAAVKRATKAHHERRVTVRPAPDTMTYLTGLLPVCDGVAVYAALDAAAKAAAASGDSRSRGQVMADTLVARVTGSSAGAHPVEISLVMTDRALLGGGDEPAHVPGYGPVPAEIARRWILSVLDLDGDVHADAPDPPAHTGHRDRAEDDDGDAGDASDASDYRTGLARQTRARRHRRGQVWLRRLYTDPGGRHLVATDSRQRAFPRLLRRLVEYRDQLCATPYCGAPIRQIDHIRPVRSQGQTSYSNARGTCARCNLAKEAPGWRATVYDTTGTGTGTGTGKTPATTPPPAPAPAPALARAPAQLTIGSSRSPHPPGTPTAPRRCPPIATRVSLNPLPHRRAPPHCRIGLLDWAQSP